MFFLSKWVSLRPRLTLSAIFVVWKILLLVITLSSPGPGYDTSTTLFEYGDTEKSYTVSPLSLETTLLKLVRWDAIYFTQLAFRGHVFEQEWAFGIAYPDLVGSLSRTLTSSSGYDAFAQIIKLGLLVSITAHWLSVIVLFEFVKALNLQNQGHDDPRSFLAAVFHILSPAGAFLSAPCSESLFSVLNLLGFLIYIQGTRNLRNPRPVWSDLSFVVSGIAFGYATVSRSNGLLSGSPFLYDCLLLLRTSLNRQLGISILLRLTCLVLGGLLVLIGMMWPQYQAYRTYCTFDGSHDVRIWCKQTVPSVYGWVQSYYWNNGLLRYWTFSNAPLFLLAAPMLFIMSYSALDTMWEARQDILQDWKTGGVVGGGLSESHNVVRMALPQLILAILIFMNAHVQIITRLSSGYPLWYIWLATSIVGESKSEKQSKRHNWHKRVVRFVLMYAMIQGGLYASFLPPA